MLQAVFNKNKYVPCGMALRTFLITLRAFLITLRALHVRKFLITLQHGVIRYRLRHGVTWTYV